MSGNGHMFGANICFIMREHPPSRAEVLVSRCYAGD